MEFFSRRITYLLALCVMILSLSLSSCSSMKPKVELTSEPSGAEIQTTLGEKIGNTPLTLEGEKLDQITKNGRFQVLVTAPGYLSRELMMEIHGEDAYQLNLRKLDSDYFDKRIVLEFSQPLNSISRELLKIQGLLFAHQYADAEKLLAEFQNKYPTIAGSYVLSAGIEIARGNMEKSNAYLNRARAMDPYDPVVARMLGVKTLESPAPSIPDTSAPPPVNSAPPLSEPPPPPQENPQ